ncbi:hypothetical protein JXA56_00080 [Candidatus Micrarchaeota archaeon]|nr:hypothetical protein [Candidatus Micrarchaeota archaeon]
MIKKNYLERKSIPPGHSFVGMGPMISGIIKKASAERMTRTVEKALINRNIRGEVLLDRACGSFSIFRIKLPEKEKLVSIENGKFLYSNAVEHVEKELSMQGL